MSLLQVKELKLRFYTYQGIVRALEGVELEIAPGEVLGLVGETGCGKTMTALSCLVLIPPPGKIEGGEVIFWREGEALDLLLQKEEVLRQIRGRELSMVFQEPGAALNPVLTIGEQIMEVILLHRRHELCLKALEEIKKGKENRPWLQLKYQLEEKVYQAYLRGSLAGRLISRLPGFGWRLRAEAGKIAVELLRGLGLPEPERMISRYPHELSGGMKQRAVIAMAVACHPKLILADEPTTSLDVTIQAQILALFRKLQEELNLAILYITHNLGVVAQICSRVAVMYAGVICEVAETKELFHNPLHPYTKALLQAIPQPGKPLTSIPGSVPNLINPPSGCRFHPRCPEAKPICHKEMPRLKKVNGEHQVACHLY